MRSEEQSRLSIKKFTYTRPRVLKLKSIAAHGDCGSGSYPSGTTANCTEGVYAGGGCNTGMTATAICTQGAGYHSPR